MSDFLRIIGCPTVFVEMWRDIMLFFGVLMALTGFYFGCQIEYSDLPSKVCVLSLFLLGISGVFLTAYAIALLLRWYNHNKRSPHELICQQKTACSERKESFVFNHLPMELSDIKEKSHKRRHSYPLQLSEEIGYAVTKLRKISGAILPVHNDGVQSKNGATAEQKESENVGQKRVRHKCSRDDHMTLRQCVKDIDDIVEHLKSFAKVRQQGPTEDNLEYLSDVKEIETQHSNLEMPSNPVTSEGTSANENQAILLTSKDNERCETYAEIDEALNVCGSGLSEASSVMNSKPHESEVLHDTKDKGSFQKTPVEDEVSDSNTTVFEETVSQSAYPNIQQNLFGVDSAIDMKMQQLDPLRDSSGTTTLDVSKSSTEHLSSNILDTSQNEKERLQSSNTGYLSHTEDNKINAGLLHKSLKDVIRRTTEESCETKKELHNDSKSNCSSILGADSSTDQSSQRNFKERASGSTMFFSGQMKKLHQQSEKNYLTYSETENQTMRSSLPTSSRIASGVILDPSKLEEELKSNVTYLSHSPEKIASSEHSSEEIFPEDLEYLPDEIEMKDLASIGDPRQESESSYSTDNPLSSDCSKGTSEVIGQKYSNTISVHFKRDTGDVVVSRDLEPLQYSENYSLCKGDNKTTSRPSKNISRVSRGLVLDATQLLKEMDRYSAVEMDKASSDPSQKDDSEITSIDSSDIEKQEHLEDSKLPEKHREDNKEKSRRDPKELFPRIRNWFRTGWKHRHQEPKE